MTDNNPILDLQKAAIEYASVWGRDQRSEGRIYWAERHAERWAALAKAAVVFSESKWSEQP